MTYEDCTDLQKAAVKAYRNGTVSSLFAEFGAPLEQQVLDIAQAEREPHMHYHHQANHPGGGAKIPERAD